MMKETTGKNNKKWNNPNDCIKLCDILRKNCIRSIHWEHILSIIESMEQMACPELGSVMFCCSVCLAKIYRHSLNVGC